MLARMRPRALAYERDATGTSAVQRRWPSGLVRPLIDRMLWGRRRVTGDPIFVGGTGRSGTHAVGALLGRHPRLAYIPREVRFHSAYTGVADALAGAMPAAELVRRLHSYWWRRTPWWSNTQAGLFEAIPRERFERAVLRFRLRRRIDLTKAAAALVAELLDPFAEAEGAHRWIEMSPPNAESAAELVRMFPDARIVHVVRDGRDVACSFNRVPWAPSPRTEALADWERRLALADRGVAAAKGQVMVLPLEELLLTHREERYSELLDFVGIEDASAMREFFEAELRPEKGNVGRWRVEVDIAEQDEFLRLYEDACDRLEKDGLSFTINREPLPEAYRLDAGVRTLSTVDPWAARQQAEQAARKAPGNS